MAFADPNDFEPAGSGTAVADLGDFEVIQKVADPSDFEPMTPSDRAVVPNDPALRKQAEDITTLGLQNVGILTSGNEQLDNLARSAVDETHRALEAFAGKTSLANVSEVFDEKQRSDSALTDIMANPPQVTPTPTLGGELKGLLTDPTTKGTYRHFKKALEIAGNAVRPSGIMGPSESDRIANSVPFGHDEQGNPTYEYKPLGDRMAREGGLFTPYLKVEPMAAREDDSALSSVGKAAFNVASGLTGGLLSPGGIMTAGAGSIPAVARPVAAAFGADMVSNVPAQLEQMFTGRNLQEKLEGGVGALASLAMGVGALKHGIAPETTLEARRSATDAAQEKALSEQKPYTRDEPHQTVTDTSIIDGLVETKKIVRANMLDQPPEVQSKANEILDQIEDGLKNFKTDDIAASEKRVDDSHRESIAKAAEEPKPSNVVPLPEQRATAAPTEAPPTPVESARPTPPETLPPVEDTTLVKPEPTGLIADSESARLDKLTSEQTPVLGKLVDAELDAIGEKVGMKRRGQSDEAFRERIANGTHPDDLADALPETKSTATPLTAEEQSKLRAAYDKVSGKSGFPAVPISEVIKESGMSAESVKRFLSEQRDQGKVHLSTGDWSIASTEERSAAIRKLGDKYTQVRYAKEKPITADQAARAFFKHNKVAVEAARSAGAVDPEMAASEAMTRLTDAAVEGKVDLSNPEGLMVDVARNAARNQLKSESAQKRGGGNVESLDAEKPEGQPIANTAASTDLTPAQVAEKADAARTVQDTVAKLPKELQEVARLKLENPEWTNAQIAKELGVSGPTVANRLKAMQKHFTPEEQAEDWTSATKLPPAPMLKRKGKPGEAAFLSLPRIDLRVADRKLSQLDSATTGRSAKLQRSTDDARRAQREIKAIVPDKVRQGGLSLWIEAGGDAAKLAAWEAAGKGEAFKKAAKAAQSLTPEEIALANKIKATFGILETRGNTYDVLKNHQDNYVPHVWDVEPKGVKGALGGGSLKENFKFAKARTFADFAEGDAAGFKPKTMAIGDLLPAYLSEMNRVIADRQFVSDISNMKAKDGRPLVVPRGRVSEITTDSGGKSFLANPDAIKGATDAEGKTIDTMDYKTLNDPALHDWRWEGKDENGNPIFMRDDLAVHPEAVRRLKAMLGKSELRRWMTDTEHDGDSPIKFTARAIDTAQSVMKREMFSLLAPFHQVQEGTHAVGHLISPFHNIPKVNLRDPAQYDAAKHGLMLLPDKTSGQQYLEGLGGNKGFISQLSSKFGGKAGQAVADVIDGYQDYLFHQYIPGLKFKTYEAIRERNMNRYKSEVARGELTEADVKLLSAEQTNAAYGHINYALLDRDPTMQHIFQLSLLAPDFLEARARFVGQAAKALLGSKSGREQFKAIAVLAATQAAAAFTITTATGNKWDPKHPFEVIVGDRRYTMRSIPEDIASLMDDPWRFSSARLNPLTVTGTVNMVRGTNYRGEKTERLQLAEELLTNYIPITARSLPGIRSLTETSRQNPVSPLEQLAGSVGLKISRHSPITNTYKKASEWMEKQGIPKDRGTYPVSKYQQLRYALEDGNMDKAKEEYDKLKKTMTNAKITSGFEESVNHPFTDSEAMDNKFRSSLSPADREVFDLAKRRRKELLWRYIKLKH